jgi:hypothetical protein
MTASDEEQRRERVRALQKMREQVPSQPVLDAATLSQNNNERGRRLRELLQRRQGANAASVQQPGGERLIQALAGRAGRGVGKNNVASGGNLLRMMIDRGLNSPASAIGDMGAGAAKPKASTANPGNRGLLLRRIMQARINYNEGQPSQYDQQISELQNRVDQLTKEVERLRADESRTGDSRGQVQNRDPEKQESRSKN